MGAQRTKEISDDFTTAGAVSSFAMTDIAHSLGSKTPQFAGGLSARLSKGTGFDQIRSYHGLLLSSAVFYGGAIYGLSFLEGQSWGLVLGTLFLIVGSVVGFGLGLALLLQLDRYSALRMRCRLWGVDEPNPNAGRSSTGHPLTDLLLVTPFKLAWFAIMAPFFALSMIMEIIRVTLLNLVGKKHVSYRGDQGKYYERVRKEYAKYFDQKGVEAANEYLRIAYSGLLSPIGTEIPKAEWQFGRHEQWLAKMIERHGPVTKYCSGKPGSVIAKPADTRPTADAKVPDKYSAL